MRSRRDKKRARERDRNKRNRKYGQIKKKAFPQGNLVLCDGSTCYGSDSGIDCNGIYE